MGMDNSTLAQGALAMQSAGVVTSTFGAYNSAKGQKAALQYQANVAANDQKLSEDQARIALINGEVDETNSELKTTALMGDQRAALAANGVDLGTGSPSEILATSKFMGTRDALTIRDNAARRAWAFRQTGKGYAAEAAMDTSTAGAISPFASAAGSLLSGAGTVASSWYKYNKSVNGAGS